MSKRTKDKPHKRMLEWGLGPLPFTPTACGDIACPACLAALGLSKPDHWRRYSTAHHTHSMNRATRRALAAGKGES